MVRLIRIAAVVAVILVIAWLVMEMLGMCSSRKANAYVRKMRLNGV